MPQECYEGVLYDKLTCSYMFAKRCKTRDEAQNEADKELMALREYFKDDRRFVFRYIYQGVTTEEESEW